MDKKIGQLVSHTIFQMPTAMGKGVLVTPTVHGNLMVGPTATDISDKEGVDTTAEGLDEVLKKAALSVKSLPRGVTITSFAGLRAHEDHDDFILGEVKDAPGFFDAVGIESPGLTSAPAIGEWMAEKIVEKLRKTQKVDEKKDFQETRKDIPNIASMDQAEAAALIAENPAYGTIICRCEKVTEGEIIDAIRAASGSPFPGWNQAADQGGYGTLSGRILLYEGHGHSGKGAGDSSGGSHESRRRVQDADRR